jgi:O-methyltransferase involved in polyketide biosynthesis
LEKKGRTVTKAVAIQQALYQTLDAEDSRRSVSQLLIDLASETNKGLIALIESATRPVKSPFRAVFIMRSRHTEDCLAESLVRGVGQYVILGAGLDTFAYRQPAWAGSLGI